MHFKHFEVLDPDWYNINFFAAQALACLGKYEESLLTYQDAYRKQRAPINEVEVADFSAKVQAIRELRKDEPA